MVVEKGYLIAGGIVIAVLVVGLIFSLGYGGSREKPSVTAAPEISKTDAAEQAIRKIVASYLKSPGSAQFSNVISRQQVNQPDSFIVFGDVDAENSFSALLRSHFFAELHSTGGSLENAANWSLDTFDFGGTNYVFAGKPISPPLEMDRQMLDTDTKMEDLYRNFK